MKKKTQRIGDSNTQLYVEEVQPQGSAHQHDGDGSVVQLSWQVGRCSPDFSGLHSYVFSYVITCHTNMINFLNHRILL